MVDVVRILQSHKVHYVEKGPNVAKGNVNIKCPWCGEADSSQHLGINLNTGMWGCWRNKQHRGRKLSRLLTKLLGISLSEARRIAGEGKSAAVESSDFGKALHSLSGASTSLTARDLEDSQLSLPKSFAKLTGRTRGQRLATDYLVNDRGFPKSRLIAFARRYDLRYTLSGDFAERIIVPVYEDGNLMTYLGRSVYPTAPLRYRALSKDDSIKQVKDCVYNFDHANCEGRILYIVEGAFDVFKIDWYNHKHGVTAVGLFNMNVEPTQLELLYRLRGLYDHYIGILDKGEVASTMRLESELSLFFNGFRTIYLKDAEDPGAMTEKQAKSLRRI